MEKYPKNNWEDLVKLQTKVPYQVMLFVEKESSFKKVKESLNILNSQEIKPNLVTLINKQYMPYSKSGGKEYLKPSELLELIKSYDFHQFSLKNVYDDEASDRSMIDLTFDGNKKKPYPFYVSFSTEFEIPKTFSKELNDAVLIKMMQIGVAKPVDGINGLIVNKVAHEKHGGNSFDIDLEKKIEKYEENSHRFIYEAKDICPSLK